MYAEELLTYPESEKRQEGDGMRAQTPAQGPRRGRLALEMRLRGRLWLRRRGVHGDWCFGLAGFPSL